jgi:hypothetical protein
MADTWTDRLSEYVDDEVAPDERRLIEAHLAGCDACGRAVRELREVVARAAALASRPPAQDLWPGIERQLNASEAGMPAPAHRLAVRRISLTMPQLVAAGLALMVMSGSAVWILQHGGTATSLPPVSASDAAPSAPASPDRAVPVALNDPHYDEAIADLQDALRQGRGRLDSQTVTVLEKNLAAIDRAIDESRRALEADPANVFLNTHLADARQRKLALLRQAVAIATTKGL